LCADAANRILLRTEGADTSQTDGGIEQGISFDSG
jgi:hypothetical protein